MIPQDFRAAPFHLDDAGMDWVAARFAALTPRQKIGQLFNVMVRDTSPETLCALKVGAPGSIALIIPGTATDAGAVLDDLNTSLPVPLLVTADLEGSLMTPPGATPMPNPLGLAAIGDPGLTEAASRIIARQGRERGVNWSFTPLLDINATHRSAIVATRGFGSDIDTIRAHAMAHLEALQGSGVAATLKHWPGEGYDDRDQHLVTTINPLGMTDWDATFGSMYRDGIARGVLSVMSAHIGFPAYMRDVHGVTGIEAYRPASINRHLNEDLLRGTLGFKGVIVSDATPMAGLGSWLPRRDFVPQVLMAGCDVILFTPDLGQDISWMEQALSDGRATWARVDEAVLRQLALKAAVGLHKAVAVPSGDRAAEDAFGADLMARVPTLVKDGGILPISPAKTPRVLLVSKGVILPFVPHPLPLALAGLLRDAGFSVTEHKWGTPVDPADHDLLIYAFAEESLLTRGHIYINWAEMTGSFEGAMARPWHDIATIMLSFGHPYYLYDAPMVPTYINAYSALPEMQAAVVRALTGNEGFNGTSPIDPFCGMDMS